MMCYNTLMFSRENVRDYLYCENYYLLKRNRKGFVKRFIDDSIDLNVLLMKKLKIDNYGSGKISNIVNKDAIINFNIKNIGLNFKVDAIVRNKNKFDVYFTYNSTSFRSLEKKIIDITLQLLEKINIDINKVYIVTLNSKYVNTDKLNPDELLIISDKLYDKFNLKVIKNKPKVNIDQLVDAMKNKIQIDRQLLCKHKSRCIYHNECLARQNKDIVNDDYGEFTFDKERVQGIIKKWEYPLIYLDFEWKTCPVPLYKGMGVNGFLPFQYSMHIEYEDGKLEHKSFLGRYDCRESFIKQLLKDIPKSGTIIAYNANGAEKCQLKRLSIQFPLYKKQLGELNDRTVDLAQIFNKHWVYHPLFKGSYSLKTIVRVLCDKDYKQLPISDGVEAVCKYLEYEKSGYRDIKIKKDLEKYCGMDTYSEYLIVKYLKKQIEVN